MTSPFKTVPILLWDNFVEHTNTALVIDSDEWDTKDLLAIEAYLKSCKLDFDVNYDGVNNFIDLRGISYQQLEDLGEALQETIIKGLDGKSYIMLDVCVES